MPVTIERTSKKWKAMKVRALMIFIVGGVIVGLAMPDRPGSHGTPMMGAIGFCTILVSLVIWLQSRYGEWWDNG